MPQKPKSNPERYEKKCVICKTKNAQLHSMFCARCFNERKAEALTHLNMDVPDHRTDTMDNEPRGWW